MNGAITTIIVVNVIFLITHIAASSRLKKTKITTRKKARTLNGILFAMPVVYIALNFLIMHRVAYEEYFDPTTATVVVTAMFYLILSPYFWWSSIYLLSKTFLYTRINMKAKYTKHSDYNRDDLAKVHPGLLSLVYNFRAGELSDITAVLLKLKLEGYIEESDGKLHTVQKSTENLLESEKQVLEAVAQSGFSPERYEEAVKEEAKEQRLISGAGDSDAVKSFKIFLNCLLPFTIAFSILMLVGYIFATYKTLNEVNTGRGQLYVEVSEEVYNANRGTGWGEISNPTGVHKSRENKYYIRADRLGGHHAVLGSRDTRAVVLGLCAIIGPYMAILAYSLISSQMQSFKYDFKRTGAGCKLINDAIGLKNFLKEFSIIKERRASELPLWEYYLIYATVLEVNVKVQDEVISSFAGSILNKQSIV